MEPLNKIIAAPGVIVCRIEDIIRRREELIKKYPECKKALKEFVFEGE